MLGINPMFPPIKALSDFYNSPDKKLFEETLG
jgi:hypothetical protein